MHGRRLTRRGKRQLSIRMTSHRLISHFHQVEKMEMEKIKVTDEKDEDEVCIRISDIFKKVYEREDNCQPTPAHKTQSVRRRHEICISRTSGS